MQYKIDFSNKCSVFWLQDTSTVDSAHPRLSECFQQTALTFLPCGWLWLTAGFHLVYLRRHTRFISLPITRLHTARLVRMDHCRAEENKFEVKLFYFIFFFCGYPLILRTSYDNHYLFPRSITETRSHITSEELFLYFKSINCIV